MPGSLEVAVLHTHVPLGRTAAEDENACRAHLTEGGIIRVGTAGHISL